MPDPTDNDDIPHEDGDEYVRHDWLADLVEFYGVEDGAEWLATECDGLDGLSPLAAVAAGRQVEVEQLLSAVIDGAYV